MMRTLVLPVFVWVLSVPVICVAGDAYAYIHSVYVCALCSCALWEYVCFAAGWTQGHGAAVASLKLSDPE